MQGQFTVHADGYVRARSCHACGAATAPTGSHLLRDCEAMSTPLAAAIAATPRASLQRDGIAERFWAPHSADDILRMVQVCGRLQLAYAACCRDTAGTE